MILPLPVEYAWMDRTLTEGCMVEKNSRDLPLFDRNGCAT